MLRVLVISILYIVFLTTNIFGQNLQKKDFDMLKQPLIFNHTNEIPHGYHAHKMNDGSFIVHHDSNHGKSVPHSNIEYPWNKYYGILENNVKFDKHINIQKTRFRFIR